MGHHEHVLQWGETDSESEGPSWRDWMCTVSHFCSFSAPLVSPESQTRIPSLPKKRYKVGASSSEPPFRGTWGEDFLLTYVRLRPSETRCYEGRWDGEEFMVFLQETKHR